MRFVIFFALLRKTRKTGAVSIAPPKRLASSIAHWRRAATAFALLTVAACAQSGAPKTALPKTAPADVAQQALQHQRESLEKQRRSLTMQLGEPIDAKIQFADSDFLLPSSPEPEAACLPVAVDEVETTIQTAAKKNALSTALIKAVIKQESGFRPCAVSPKGAQGLMQLTPETAKQMHLADPFDPDKNIEAGAAYLKQMLDRYKGDLRLALVAYNAGPARADQPKTAADNAIAYPLETQNYVAGVFAQLGITQWDETEKNTTAATPPSSAKPSTPQ
jgi:soluble lytic murein transglycosylase-like protein